jgi:hypothetical protein
LVTMSKMYSLVPVEAGSSLYLHIPLNHKAWQFFFVITSFQPEILLSNFKNLVPISQKEKDRLVNAACSENHMEHMLCRQNASFFMLKHVD